MKTRRSTLAVGLSSIAVALGLVWLALSAPNGIPGTSHYTIDAQLVDATGLFPHAQVREAGRLVGQILDPRIEDGRATVTLQLDNDVGPLPRDTRLRVRAQSAIGQNLLEIERGRAATTIPDGGRVPVQQSRGTVAIDQVLGTLDATTRRRTQSLIAALGAGTAGRGEDLGRTLAAAPLTLARAASVARTLTAKPHALPRLVRQGARAARTLARARDDIAATFDPAQRALAPIARRRAELAAAIDVAPGTLATARTALAHADPVLDDLAALTRTLQRTLPRAPRALDATSALLASGRRALPQLRPTLALARRAVPPALDLLAAADPVAQRMRDTIGQASPLVDVVAPRGCDLVRLVNNWESMLGFGNAGGNYLRVNIISPSVSSLGGQRQSLGVLPEYRNVHPAPCQAVDDRIPIGGHR